MAVREDITSNLFVVLHCRPDQTIKCDTDILNVLLGDPVLAYLRDFLPWIGNNKSTNVCGKQVHLRQLAST